MARVFQSASNTLNLTRAAALVTAVPVTLACWCNCPGFSSFPMVCKVEDGTAANSFGIYMGSGGAVNAETKVAGSGSAAASTANAAINTWYHAAAVFTSITSRAAYLNGANKGTDATSKTPTGLNSCAIGCDPGQVPAIGTLANFACWNVALTDNEILALGKGASPLLVRPGSLLSFCPIIGQSPEPDFVIPSGWTVSGSVPAFAASNGLFGPQ